MNDVIVILSCQLTHLFFPPSTIDNILSFLLLTLGGEDGMIRIWNMKTGELLGVINAHSNAMITSIAVSMVHTNTPPKSKSNHSISGNSLGPKSLPSPKQQQPPTIPVLRPMIVSCGRDNKCCVFDLQAEGSPVEGIFV